MRSVKSKLSAILAFAALGMSACGDSTGPSKLDSAAALQSLALGFQRMGATGVTATLNTGSSFGGLAPFLNQVTVNIEGKPQTMFGLAIHETFPAGTCWEVIFENVIPAGPSCTPPPLALAVVLWQSHSASEMPDRLLFLAGDVGTVDFSFDPDQITLPAVAFYVEGENDIWVSESGTLTSAVSATSQSCNVPLPLYAKSGSCSIAVFDEQGSIVFSSFNTITGTSPFGPTRTLTIPRQTLHGLWMAISEIQPIGFTANRLVPRSLMQRVAGR